MKKTPTLIITLIVSLQMFAAPVYTVSASTNWTSLVGSNCTGCTFNIASGVTFTLNTGNNCTNCTFNGGTLLLTSDFIVQQSAFVNSRITIDGQKLTLQGGGVDNSFSGVTVTANGSGGVIQTAKTTITNSTFGFSGLAQYFENGGQLDITGSHFYLYDNASFYANAGPVNLNSSSNITAGDGSSASKAYIYMNGPQLTLADANSTFSLANFNNYYFNWGTYKSASNSMTYSTSINTANCGTAGKNSCAAPKYYGCAMFSKTGASNCTVLSAMISDFAGALVSGNQIRLNWSLQTTDEGTVMVERSFDAVHFETITSRPAQTSKTWSFTDVNPAAGTNYYRITLTAFDGAKTQSGILSVKAAASVSGTAAQIFPNPVTNGRITVRLSSTQTALYSLFTQDGRLLGGKALSGQTEYAIELPKTASTGLLIIRIICGDQTSSFPLMNKIL